jgi:hypothetical protein
MHESPRKSYGQIGLQYRHRSLSPFLADMHPVGPATHDVMSGTSRAADTGKADS